MFIATRQELGPRSVLVVAAPDPTTSRSAAARKEMYGHITIAMRGNAIKMLVARYCRRHDVTLDPLPCNTTDKHDRDARVSRYQGDAGKSLVELEAWVQVVFTKRARVWSVGSIVYISTPCLTEHQIRAGAHAWAERDRRRAGAVSWAAPIDARCEAGGSAGGSLRAPTPVGASARGRSRSPSVGPITRPPTARSPPGNCGPTWLSAAAAVLVVLFVCLLAV